MGDGPVAAVSTKPPVGMRDKLAALARRRNVTPSALIRGLVEAFLAGSIDDGEVGGVERAVRAEFEDSEVGPGSRPAMAVNLARRMDRDPTAGAANARELRWFLTVVPPCTPNCRRFAATVSRRRRVFPPCQLMCGRRIRVGSSGSGNPVGPRK